MEYTDQIFNSFSGLGPPESSFEDDFFIQSVLDNFNLPSSWQTYGKGTDFGSLVPGGQEVDVPINWDRPFLESNPYTQSALTLPCFQPMMDFTTFPVVANCFDAHLVEAAQEAYPSAVPKSIPWPSPSASELPQLISTPTPETCEPQRPQKRTRRKRVSRPMREIRKMEKPEVCEECGKGFDYKKGLYRHMRSHNRKKGIPTEVFECFHCDAAIGEKHNLKRHLENKHGDLYAGASGLRLKVLRVGSSLVFRGWLEGKGRI